MALEIAKKAKELGARVPGNHLNKPPEVVHFRNPKKPRGFSLADWGPVDVKDPEGKHIIRPGFPVITVEPFGFFESRAFEDGTLWVDEVNLWPLVSPPVVVNPKRAVLYRRERARELRAHAQALIDVLLEST